MSDAPVFTLESANALVPRLNAIVGEQMRRRAVIEDKLAALGVLLGESPAGLDPVQGDAPEVAALRAETRAIAVEYREEWREVEELGGVLKDPQRGLVDFYGRVDGELVWFCWRYGEDRVAHYHGLEEGFPGRKPILHAVKHRLIN
jgi:hypothetical protein